MKPRGFFGKVGRLARKVRGAVSPSARRQARRAAADVGTKSAGFLDRIGRMYRHEAERLRDSAKPLPPDAKEASLCLKRAAEYEALAADAKAAANRIRAEEAKMGNSKK